MAKTKEIHKTAHFEAITGWQKAPESFYMSNEGCCSLKKKKCRRMGHTSDRLLYRKQFGLVYLQGLELRLFGRSNNRIDILFNIGRLFLFLNHVSIMEKKACYAQNKNMKR